MSIALATIADSITGITVSGLTIKDVDQIPTAINQRECPLLIPNPENYISNCIIGVDSFGSGTSRKMTLTYNLNYILIYSTVGAGRTHVIDAYSGMLAKAVAFLDAFYVLEGLTGSVDFEAELGNPAITTVGEIDFHSIGITIMIKEFIN